MTVSPAWVPLEGMVAIEASAGTGKTFTIEELYLRLVVERRLEVASILVVTYTKAATAELRQRIRARLVEARSLLATGEAPEDRRPFYDELLRRLPDRAEARRAVERALGGFDESAIFTIHAFCQRVLAEHAFESGVAFDAELVPEEQELVLEVVDDFWRRELYAASPALVRHLLDEHWSPETLSDTLRSHVGRRYGRIVAPPDRPDVPALEAAVAVALAQVRGAWTAARSRIELFFRTAPLARASFRKNVIASALAGMDELACSAEPCAELPDWFPRFTSTRLTEGAPAGWQPDDPFIALCDRLAAADAARAAGYATLAAWLRGALLAYADEELGRRKAERGIQFYDDLLRALARALADPVRGTRLAEAIRGRYRAALIDEFQDTDPVQYEVVHRIYGGTAYPVVLVGDPKQAIYSFRGADVFSYLRAKAEAALATRLDMNWRADAALVQAVNVLFGVRGQPFVLDGIPFVPVQSARAGDPPRLVDGEPGAALQLWWMDDEGEQIGKEQARERAARATAAEIARLLERGRRGVAIVAEQPLVGGDVAVLVRTNDEGRRMREALLAHGVPSVQQAVDSVFASREAEELERVLLAVAEPAQAALVRAALATEMLGRTADDLERLAADDAAWDERIETFHEYHHRWSAHGFVWMLRDLVVRERVAERLLAFPDGERRLTNLAHVSELLQATAAHQRGGMDALVEWLADARQAVRPLDVTEEAHLVRLESDAGLVQIVTVHKAKGLQYPVVFCPFLWDGRLHAERAETVVCHEPGVDGPTLDLGAPVAPERRARARTEELAERLRLLYVALTRAKHRCHVVWGNVNEGGTSALAWLLHAGTPPADIDGVKAHYGGLDGARLRAELRPLVAAGEGTISVATLPAGGVVRFRPPAVDVERLAPRRLRHRLRAGYTVASFSALVAEDAELERRDFDQMDERPREESAAPRRDVHGFPRGARAGLCLHAILEATDFVAPDRGIIGPALATAGIEDAWTPVVGDWIERVLATPLDETAGFRLDTVPRARRVDELEFYYPIHGLDLVALAHDLADVGFAGGAFADAAARLPSRTIEGFFKGFIDCVLAHDGRYFVLDYKSNWLGDSLDAYAAPALVPAMARGQYWLQYLIYAVAVHRWLGRRVPDYDYERHFGGVRYLFLRGMDPARGMRSGVYADRPGRAVIERIDAVLAGRGR
jgi:exodeoxyribonuclease V beta subunit